MVLNEIHILSDADEERMLIKKVAECKVTESVTIDDHALKHLDSGIEPIVLALRDGGVETCESCQGGDGHAFPEPTVRFSGGKAEGYRALAVALQFGLKVAELRRVWPILDYEPTGPYWEMDLRAFVII